MRILFTGFTSRTIGSDRNQYDYLSNVGVLAHTLELAGHKVDQRAVSLETDPCIEEDYDCALIGIATMQGLASRYKIGATWAMHRFGSRAGLFPSDGKNVSVFPSSVLTCLSGSHGDRTPLEYFFYGQLDKEKPHFVEADIAAAMPGNAFQSVLQRLPHSVHAPSCAWNILIPTHSWGNPLVYQQHFGAPVSTWDPTNIAIPMQFTPSELDADGRLKFDGPTGTPADIGGRKRAWVVSSLQDQGPWIKKQKCAWSVITVGNKRKAAKGEGDGYMPEKEMIASYYRDNWGALVFGYPLASGGWWRMRIIHAGMAGIVSCCDENDARCMPTAFKFSRISLEKSSDAKLAEVAEQQWQQLRSSAMSVDESVTLVDNFVKNLI